MPTVWVRAGIRPIGVISLICALALSFAEPAFAGRNSKKNRPRSFSSPECTSEIQRLGTEKGSQRKPSPAAPAQAAWQSLPHSSAAPSSQSVEALRELRVGTYNVLNLFLHQGKYVDTEDDDGGRKQVKPQAIKPVKYVRGIAKAILESKLDVVVLQEVESKRTLEKFSAEYLNGEYEAYLTPGNDSRGIEVGFLVRKSLPFTFELRTHIKETWADPTKDGKILPLFSRDVPTLIVRAPGLVKPLFILMGAHYKSKRDRADDDESYILREAQVERTAKLIGDYRNEFGDDAPILLAGDFNGDLHAEPTFRSLHKNAKLIDSLDAQKEAPSKRDRITHTYHPRGDKTEKRQLDAILISDCLAKMVMESFVYRYEDENGRVLPIPDTFEQRKRNPSDHYPVIAVFDFQELLKSRR